MEIKFIYHRSHASMMEEGTILLIGLGVAVVVGGVAFGNIGSGVVDPVADVAHDVTGVLPWLEGELSKWDDKVLGWV